MKLLLRRTLAFVLVLIISANGFTDPHLSAKQSKNIPLTTSKMSENPFPATPHHPFCDLPGDPSLMLTTNVDLGAKKLEIMKGKGS